MTRFRWIEPEPIAAGATPVVDHSVLNSILLRRGMREPDEVARWLSPSLDDLGDPFDLPDMALAVERLQQAVRDRAPVAIFGDYDVDGLTSTSLLVRVLRTAGADVRAYVPHRARDGYGLKARSTRRIIEDGARLLVTLDNGTSSADCLALAHDHGLETIVVDHHHVAADALDGTAFVSPQRAESRFPCRSLAAVGVTYALARALVGNTEAERYLPLVALGTVADVVPLVEENRVLVQAGLARFARTGSPGLLALSAAAGADPTTLTAWHLGFLLGPRINAAGRIADPGIALDLLLTDDPEKADQLARQLSRLNASRQQQTATLLEEAEQLVGPDLDKPFLLVAGEGWSIGLVGLVAAKLSERFGRPALVLSRSDGELRGSARSVDGFDIVAELERCEDLLDGFGGHSRAAGLTVQTNRLPELRQRLIEAADRAFSGRLPQPVLRLDAELPPDEISLELLAELDRLQPCGNGNEAPRFLLRDVRPRQVRLTRDGNHVQLRLPRRDGRYIDGIYFGGRDDFELLAGRDAVDLACALEVDRYWGAPRVRTRVLDARPAGG